MKEGGVGLRDGDLLNGTRGGDDLGDLDLDLDLDKDLDLLLVLGDLELELALRGDLESDRW